MEALEFQQVQMLSRLRAAQGAQVLLAEAVVVQGARLCLVRVLRLVAMEALVSTLEERHQLELEREPSTLVVLVAEDFWVLEVTAERVRQLPQVGMAVSAVAVAVEESMRQPLGQTLALAVTVLCFSTGKN